MTGLFFKIEQDVLRLPGWCPIDKMCTMAAMVVALRPATIVSIGIYGGRSIIPMALACKEIKHGVCYGIDPWDVVASVADQPPEHAEHWGKVDHEQIYNGFMDAVKKFGIAQQVRVIRSTSDAADISKFKSIDLLEVDGNHSLQALRDVQRFCPLISVGGICILDDLDWGSGPVQAEAWIIQHGFKKLYPLGTGAVYQRIA